MEKWGQFRLSFSAESGDVLIPIAEGAIDASHVAGTVGQLLAGRVAGRRGPDEITLFKSLGLALEDVASAVWIAREARTRGRGVDVAFP